MKTLPNPRAKLRHLLEFTTMKSCKKSRRVKASFPGRSRTLVPCGSTESRDRHVMKPVMGKENLSNLSAPSPWTWLPISTNIFLVWLQIPRSRPKGVARQPYSSPDGNPPVQSALHHGSLLWAFSAASNNRWGSRQGFMQFHVHIAHSVIPLLKCAYLGRSWAIVTESCISAPGGKVWISYQNSWTS